MTDTQIASGTPLVIAAHGTRDEAGVAECRALAERVARKLPGIPVELGFVELAEPGIPEAVRAAVAQAPDNPEGADGDVLSDDRIVEILKEAGIDIARRTVAKYREALRIPSSVQRRRLMRTA